MGMDHSEPGLFADGADPAVGRASVESLTVVAVQDRTLAALAEHEVDGAGYPWDEGDHRGLVALADDAERPVTTVEAQVLRVGRTGLAHPKPVQAEEHRQGGVVTVVAFGREQEGAEFSAVEATSLARVDLGAADVLGRVGTDAPVDVGEAIKTADGREATVDGRGGQSPLLAGGPPQLDVGPLGLEHHQSDAVTPLEIATQVETVGLQGPSAVAGQEGRRSHMGLFERARRGTHQRCRVCIRVRHRLPPCRGDDSEHPSCAVVFRAQ